MGMMAVLGGADGRSSVHRRDKSLEGQLPSLLELPNGILSFNVIRRVLCGLQPTPGLSPAVSLDLGAALGGAGVRYGSTENRRVILPDEAVQRNHRSVSGNDPESMHARFPYVTAWPREGLVACRRRGLRHAAS